MDMRQKLLCKMKSLSLMCKLLVMGPSVGIGISYYPPADSIIGAAIATWKTHVCQVVNPPASITQLTLRAFSRSL